MMTTAVPQQPISPSVAKRRLLWAMIAGGLLVSVAMGVRQAFGLFLTPFSFEHGLPITLWAFAVALHNLVWGLAQPLTGAAADRYGAPVVVIAGAFAYAAGLALTGMIGSSAATIVGTGVLVGIGLSCMSFGIILAAIGRAASPQERSNAMGLTTAIGSIGQVIIPFVAQRIIDDWGTSVAFVTLASVVLVAAPFCLPLRIGDAPHSHESEPASLGMVAVVRAALADRNYLLLTIGFFTCGFQLAFIATHLPNYLVLCHLPIGLGATALAVIGFFNMFGSWLCGRAGVYWKPQAVLGWLYLVRAAALCAFLLLPKTPLVVLGFAAVMGFLWLGTVPLTNHVIARSYGVRNLGVLFGGCFFSHQIGSFLGAWLGGVAFDMTGSYDVTWALTAAAGVFAALMHFPIRDRAALEPTGQPG